MFISNLRKVGGSVMLAVPPAILEMAQLRVGSTVNITAEGGRLIIEPQPGKCYSLRELLAQCDASAALPDDNSQGTASTHSGNNQWTASAPVGQELI